MKTFILKKEEVQRKWYLVDAKDEILGRLASRIALVLQGKNKPSYTPNVDMSDFVVVINAEKIKVTGKKLKTKQYERHSTYPGGLKIEKFETLLNTKPAEVIKKAVKRMLPVNKLRDQRMKKLKIYKGSEHPHKSVKIKPINLTKNRN